METKAKKELIAEGKHLQFVKRGRWEYVERPGVTGIVSIAAVTDDSRIVLVEQYRPPIDAPSIELPAGLAGDVLGHEDEPLQNAAARELLEETGYEAAEWRHLFDGTASAGISNEVLTFFLATSLTKVGPGGGDASEDIIVHEVSLDEVADWLNRKREEGCVSDLKIHAVLPYCPAGAKQR